MSVCLLLILAIVLYEKFKEKFRFDLADYCRTAEPYYNNLPDGTEKKFFLSYNDYNEVNKLLTPYRELITNKYFKKTMIPLKKVNSEQYFMFTLAIFLWEYSEKDFFANGLRLLESMEDINPDCEEHNGAKIYPLTQFGVIYCKLCYLVFYYCNENVKQIVKFPADEMKKRIEQNGIIVRKI